MSDVSMVGRHLSRSADTGVRPVPFFFFLGAKHLVSRVTDVDAARDKADGWFAKLDWGVRRGALASARASPLRLETYQLAPHVVCALRTYTFSRSLDPG